MLKHHAMKTYGEWRYSSSILDLGTRWRCVVSFNIRARYSRCKSVCTRCIGGWVGTRADLDAVQKRKIFAPARNRNPAVQPIARSYND
jgi:hypothetical protein